MTELPVRRVTVVIDSSNEHLGSTSVVIIKENEVTSLQKFLETLRAV